MWRVQEIGLRVLLWGAVAAALAPLARAERPDEDRVRTERLALAYEQAGPWPVKALALLSLGERWHPVGARIVVEAVRSGDARLQAYALEALLATSPAEIGCVLVPDLVDSLVTWQAREQNPRVRVNLLLLLARCFPDAASTTPDDWRRWWRAVQPTYQPPPWREQPSPDAPAEGETRTVPAPSTVERALDLSQGGMQVVLVLDTTGSMQPTIEAVKTGLQDVVTLLSALSDPLEVGLVHYRDLADLGGGAGTLVRLTRQVKEVSDRLGSLAAGGGGDLPERVEQGLAEALDRRMGWDADANKVVVLVGDAPPHDLARAVELASGARERPEAIVGRPRVVTGAGAPRPLRPVVVSALAVAQVVPWPETVRAFEEISRAGGGFCVPFRTGEGTRQASRDLVSRLVEMSFGERHADQARRLVDLWFRYRDAGFIDR